MVKPNKTKIGVRFSILLGFFFLFYCISKDVIIRFENIEYTTTDIAPIVKHYSDKKSFLDDFVLVYSKENLKQINSDSLIIYFAQYKNRVLVKRFIVDSLYSNLPEIDDTYIKSVYYSDTMKLYKYSFFNKRDSLYYDSVPFFELSFLNRELIKHALSTHDTNIVNIIDIKKMSVKEFKDLYSIFRYGKEIDNFINKLFLKSKFEIDTHNVQTFFNTNRNRSIYEWENSDIVLARSEYLRLTPNFVKSNPEYLFFNININNEDDFYKFIKKYFFYFYVVNQGKKESKYNDLITKEDSIYILFKIKKELIIKRIKSEIHISSMEFVKDLNNDSLLWTYPINAKAINGYRCCDENCDSLWSVAFEYKITFGELKIPVLSVASKVDSINCFTLDSLIVLYKIDEKFILFIEKRKKELKNFLENRILKEKLDLMIDRLTRSGYLWVRKDFFR